MKQFTDNWTTEYLMNALEGLNTDAENGTLCSEPLRNLAHQIVEYFKVVEFGHALRLAQLSIWQEAADRWLQNQVNNTKS